MHHGIPSMLCLFSMVSGISHAQTDHGEIERIVAAMEAARVSPNLHIEFTARRPQNDDAMRLTGTAVFEAVYTQGDKGRKAIEWIEYLEDPDGNRSRATKSRRFTFDGTETRHLDRDETRGTKSWRGLRMHGFQSQFYPGRGLVFHEQVWGLGGPESYAAMLRDAKSSSRIVGEEQLEELRTLKIECRSQTPPSNTLVELWLAIDRQYLPVRHRCTITTPDETIVWDTKLQDIREVAPGIWYPHEIILTFPGVDPAFTTRWTATAVEVKETAAETFAPPFPPETLVNDLVEDKVYLVEAEDAEQAPLPERSQERLEAVISEAEQQAIKSKGNSE